MNVSLLNRVELHANYTARHKTDSQTRNKIPKRFQGERERERETFFFGQQKITILTRNRANEIKK